MFRILLIGSLALVVVGGGTAGWWFGVRGEPFPFASAQASEGEATAMPAGLEFVELAPMTFPVMRDGQVSELMTYTVRLEVADQAAEDLVKARAPAVRDAMLSELHGLYAYRFVQQRDDKVALIKRRLLTAARGAVDADVRAVLVQGLTRRAQQAQRP